MGDACEMLVAAELTLAGIPALKAPDNWPGYDVIAQPEAGGKPLRISVKSRTFSEKNRDVGFDESEIFDWLAIVLLGCGPQQNEREIYLIPAAFARATARKNAASTKSASLRYWPVKAIAKLFAEFKGNFKLAPHGRAPAP